MLYLKRTSQKEAKKVIKKVFEKKLKKVLTLPLKTDTITNVLWKKSKRKNVLWKLSKTSIWVAGNNK